MSMRPLLLTALLFPLPVHGGDFVGVSVEAGTSVTKTFSNRLSLELVDVAIRLDGEDQELPAGSKPTVRILDEEEVVFVDRYVAVADGRGTEIVRTFETLEDTSSQTIVPPGGEEVVMEEVGESGLLGASVKFTWDDDGYGAEFAGDEEDEDLLEGLEGDGDYLYLLSDEPMELGSSWELEPLILDRLSSPSGDLKIHGEDADLAATAAFASGFRDNLDGEVSARVEAMDGETCTIALRGVVTTVFEVSATDDEDAMQTMDFEFEVAGKLIWDLERGVAKELQVEGDVTMEVSVVREFGEAELEQVQTFEGTFESSATFE